MFENRQGENENRLINSNKGGNLKLAQNVNQVFPFNGTSAILDFDIINQKQIILTIENNWEDVIGYSDNYIIPNYYLPNYLTENSTTDYPFGKLIHEFDYIRVYSNTDWLDLKIINVTGDYNETIVECLLENGNFDDINVGDSITWSFPINKENKGLSGPINLLATNITNNSLEIRWDKSSLRNDELVFQVSWKKTGNHNWEYSKIGNWVNGLKVELEANRWETPKESFNGKPAYWVEFNHNDKISKIEKAIGRITINENGNFSDFTLLNNGGGYINDPIIKLYHRNPDLFQIKNIKYSRPNNAVNLIIHKTNHPFQINDIVEIDKGRLKGDWVVTNINNNEFQLESLNNISIPVSTVTFKSGMNLKIKPVENNINPGKIIPTLNLNKYIINGLDNNTEYEIRVVSYYDRELLKYSSYSKSLKIKTR